MTDVEDINKNILHYLVWRHERSTARGCSGLMETRDIANYLRMEIRPVRDRLNRLYEDGRVIGYDGGNTSLWTVPPPSTLAGEHIKLKFRPSS